MILNYVAVNDPLFHVIWGDLFTLRQHFGDAFSMNQGESSSWTHENHDASLCWSKSARCTRLE